MKYYGKITDPKDWVTKEYADAKYTKPTTGIPASDLASGIVTQKKTVTLSTNWSGSDPYTQVVTVSGYTLTENSKVDLQPTDAQIAQLIDDGVQALNTINTNGVLTVSAAGAAPSVAMTMQCTITEVMQ